MQVGGSRPAPTACSARAWICNCSLGCTDELRGTYCDARLCAYGTLLDYLDVTEHIGNAYRKLGGGKGRS